MQPMGLDSGKAAEQFPSTRDIIWREPDRRTYTMFVEDKDTEVLP